MFERAPRIIQKVLIRTFVAVVMFLAVLVFVYQSNHVIYHIPFEILILVRQHNVWKIIVVAMKKTFDSWIQE